MLKKLLYLLSIGFAPIIAAQSTFNFRLAQAAEQLTFEKVEYDPSYYQITYPGGDVPAGKGVCTDVVIRAFRAVGMDLQKEVHEDMELRFSAYPKIWGLTKTDTNIDHRRVPNLMTYFKKYGVVKPISDRGEDYDPGDIVCWSLGGSITHIGIVSTRKNSSGSRYLIIHNIGAGQVAEDMLFDYKIIGHFSIEPH